MGCRVFLVVVDVDVFGFVVSFLSFFFFSFLFFVSGVSPVSSCLLACPFWLVLAVFVYSFI